MQYEEFDKKYNKRNRKGVITHTSIITLDGELIYSGTFDDVMNYFDNDDMFVPTWIDGKFAGFYYNGKEAITTNIGHGDKYSNYIMNKLQF